MAPQHKRPLKSYSRNVSSNRSAANILQNILTNPIEKKKNRRKPKIEIKELPPLNKHVCFTNQSDSQLEVNNYDTTFDRLLKGPNYKEVNFKAALKNNSSSESSLSILLIKKKRSPIRKRRIVKVRTRSPIVTRSISLQNSSFGINECNPNKEDENKRLQTLEVSVNESLCIEKVEVHKQKPTVHCSTSLDNKSNSIPQQREAVKENNSNLSFEPMFSETFTEKYGNKHLNMPLLANAISSTPLAPILDQRFVNETIISPIVNLDNGKFESNMTPKLRRVSKIRRSRLLPSADYQNSMLGQGSIIGNDNEISQNAMLRENFVLNDTNKENTNDSSSELVSSNKQKDLSKLLKNAVVNVTLLNVKSLGTPFINLTNIQIGPFRNKFNLNNTENSMLTKFNDHEVAVANVTFIDFERYLYHLHKDVSREVLHKKEDSETQNVSKIYRKPFVDITNINIKKYISLEYSKSEGGIEQSIRLNSNSSNQSIDTPYDSENSSIHSDLQTTNEHEELHWSIENIMYQPTVTMTQTNLEELLTLRSKSYNSKEINTQNEQNQMEKRYSTNSPKNLHQSLSNCSIVDYQSMKGASTMIKSEQLDKIDLRHSGSFRGFQRNPFQMQHSKLDSENTSQFEDVNLIFTTAKHNTPPYITLRRRKVPKVAPIKRSKSSWKTEGLELKSSVTNDFESSGSVVIVGDEESTNFRNISAENYTGLGVEFRVLDGSSVNVKKMKSEDKFHDVTPQVISPDLFKSTSLSTDAQSIIESPETKENCLQSLTNRSVIILDGNSANSVDPSIVDTSFVDFTCKSTIGFSFKTGKRFRVSQFKQRTKAYNDQSTNRSSLSVDVIENTPINITKRNKLSCTQKKNIIDLGKERSRRTNRAIKRLDLQPGMVQTELNDPVVGDCNLKSSTPETCQTSKSKSKKSLKRSDFQPDIDEIEVKDQIKDGYRLEYFTVPKTSVTSKRQSKTSLKNIDFQSAIDRSKINEQLVRDNNSVAKKVPETSKGESRKSLKKQDLQPMLEELAYDAKVNYRGSNVFAVPKLPVLKKGRNPIDDKIVLKPGKLWRRSLIEIRNSKIGLPSDRQFLIYQGK
ncbi:hypothetical protein AMK59_5141 [Oryctes borbonicus]|uniref:Uncharacterized protein n=1 Tax=Oryctes borbonicus TaxID=1629725 RepID=A0A0T6B2P0_9SCAR|nr:hypothetical protein AMK59_5141 [Oryctes borbonicus]